MVRATFHEGALVALVQKQEIATIDEMKRAMGTSSTMTVFRRLKALGYRTSYSHRGKYYTLAGTAQFDKDGLWSCRSVWFSAHGNLIQTAEDFVDQSSAGLTASELQALLHVDVKQALLHLVREKRISREKLGTSYVYMAYQKGRRKNQQLRRLDQQGAFAVATSPLREELSQELNAAIVLFYSLLDEQQRRLYAGLEAFKLGHGGDREIAKFLGLDVHTVARGRRELFGSQVQWEGVRSKGAGRPALEKKRQR